MRYFDTRTGALVDDIPNKAEVEHRLAQSYPIVPVAEEVAVIIEAGRKALEVEGNELGPLGLPGSQQPRPDAVETAEEAKANYEAELAKLRERQVTAPQDRPVIDPLAPALTEDVKVRAEGETEAKATGKKVSSTTRKK